MKVMAVRPMTFLGQPAHFVNTENEPARLRLVRRAS
jgi:hypothetical protein